MDREGTRDCYLRQVRWSPRRVDDEGGGRGQRAPRTERAPAATSARHRLSRLCRRRLFFATLPPPPLPLPPPERKEKEEEEEEERRRHAPARGRGLRPRPLGPPPFSLFFMRLCRLDGYHVVDRRRRTSRRLHRRNGRGVGDPAPPPPPPPLGEETHLRREFKKKRGKKIKRAMNRKDKRKEEAEVNEEWKKKSD